MSHRSRVSVNGQSTELVSVADRGFQYGDGVFETLAISDGQPLFWLRHWQRLEWGCERLGICVPNRARLYEEALQLISGSERGVLKIIVTRGIGKRGFAPLPASPPTHVLYMLPWPDYPLEWNTQGVDIGLCRARLSRNRQLAGIKHLNRLEQILARAELDGAFPEGLMQNDKNDIVEGTMTNVFLVSGGIVYTPDLSECGVAGVMRQVVMDQAQQLGIPIKTQVIKIDDIIDADELFLTNSLIGIWPVKRFAKQSYKIGAITRKFQERIYSEQLDAE